MRRLFLISWALFALAIALIVVSAIAGESQFGLFIIFPFVIGSGPIALAGVLVLFIAIVLIFVALMRGLPRSEADSPALLTVEERGGADKRYGGVVMIGPVPIAFGSDSKIARTMMIIGIILFMTIVMAIFLSILL